MITWVLMSSMTMIRLIWLIKNHLSVKDGAWFPHHDRHLSIQSRAKTHKGMPSKGAPKATSTGSSLDMV